MAVQAQSVAAGNAVPLSVPLSSGATDTTHKHRDHAVLLSSAAAVALLHILTNFRYGFHRDELQFLSDARHLDWGYVSYPPFTPFIQRIGLELFGLSITWLRLFSVIAQSAAIFVSGLMARELGGKRLAQVAAALTVAFSPLPLFEGTEFQYTTFDFLWWVLIAYCVIRLINTENPRWWLAIGAIVGLGLETKYAIVFYVAGLVAGTAFTPARKWIKTGWFWAGVGVALLLFLPNLVWLARHDFISYRFLHFIHIRDVGEGRAEGFWSGQFRICANFAAAPLWVAGLLGLLVNRRYRMLAFLYLIPLGFFWIANGRNYYVAGAYPMLLAMGAVIGERWLGFVRKPARLTIEAIYFAAFAAISVYVCAIVLPIADSGPLKQFALRNNGDLREEIGWDQLVRTVAQIRDGLPPAQRVNFGITTANYGEYGAIEILGAAYKLPTPIGTTNSEWLRGYPNPAPTTFIVLGLGREEADALFTGCRLAGHNGNSLGVTNEESRDHPDIFVCGPPRIPWSQLWREHRNFG